MARANKLRLVKKSDLPPGPKRLFAMQIIAIAHPDGGDGLGMIDNTGTIYLRTPEGWQAVDMEEAPHDPSV